MSDIHVNRAQMVNKAFFPVSPLSKGHSKHNGVQHVCPLVQSLQPHENAISIFSK